MEIYNIMGMRVYMETKKDNEDLGIYPRGIIVNDFDLKWSSSNASTIARLKYKLPTNVIHIGCLNFLNSQCLGKKNFNTSATELFLVEY